ncbi:MAG: Jag N-terminal domain-containing protein, partial [Oscillospiraceae bacterium]|nr:Jag N-terminal domain-containing protein [Oscillospiraceae bacterium]
MTKFIEVSGKTEEDAIKAGLKQLGLKRDEVSVEVIERARSGFLGIGSAPARLRLSYEEPEQPAPEVVAAEPTAPQPETAEAPVPAADREAAAEDASARNIDEKRARTEQYLRGLLELMGVEAQIEISDRAGGGLNVNLRGSSMGAVIGRRGDTLDA